jgi:hypothetical protein
MQFITCKLSIVIHPDVVGPVEVVVGILMRCGILFEDL